MKETALAVEYIVSPYCLYFVTALLFVAGFSLTFVDRVWLKPLS